jgi:hypothetical protein
LRRRSVGVDGAHRAEHATRIMTEYGVRATPAEIRDFVQVASRLALEDCFTILPPDAPRCRSMWRI